MSTQMNPYAPPSARVDDVFESSAEEESIRREHIKHEASIRSVGSLYLLGGVFGVIGAIGLLAAALTGETGGTLALGLAALYLVLAVLSLAAGRGLRKLQPWARTISIVLAAIGLLGFPVGTLINGYILYLMLSAKGKRIFEPDYLDIVAATPQIKYKTSIVVWIVLGILVLAILAAVVVPILGR